MFEKNPNARSDFKAGTLYAIWGLADWIYYGQVAVDKSVAFIFRRDRKIAASADVLVSPIMSRMGVDFASVGRALRSGAWKKLGKYPLGDELGKVRPVVQWPVGTLDVTVWIGHAQSRATRVEDPSIQNLEIMQLGTRSITFQLDWRLTTRPMKQSTPWLTSGPSEDQSGENDA